MHFRGKAEASGNTRLFLFTGIILVVFCRSFLGVASKGFAFFNSGLFRAGGARASWATLEWLAV